MLVIPLVHRVLRGHVVEMPQHGCAENHQIRLKPCNANSLDLQVVACPKQVASPAFQKVALGEDRGGQAICVCGARF